MGVERLHTVLRFVRLNHKHNQTAGFEDFWEVLVRVLAGDSLQDGCCMTALCDLLMDPAQGALSGGYWISRVST